jgi:hypothetical protein
MNHNERRDMPIIIGIAIAVLLVVILGLVLFGGPRS